MELNDVENPVQGPSYVRRLRSFNGRAIDDDEIGLGHGCMIHPSAYVYSVHFVMERRRAARV